MKKLLTAFAFFSVALFGAQPPYVTIQGFELPLTANALAAVNPSGTPLTLQTDISGNLMTTGPGLLAMMGVFTQPPYVVIQGAQLPLSAVALAALDPNGNPIALQSDANGNLMTTGGSGGSSVVIASVQTASFNATVGNYYPIDTTSGSVTVTLPNAPANNSMVGMKQVIRGGTNTVTYNTQGSDVINRASGPTTGTITLSGQASLLQYTSATKIWTVISDDLPYGSLQSAANVFTGVNNFNGSSINTPVTITPSAGAGTLVTASAYSQVTISAALTLNFDATGTVGQKVRLDINNTDTALHAVTLGTHGSGTATAPASGITPIILQSDGTTWTVTGGDPSVVGLSALTNPASTVLIPTTDPTTGAVTKSTIAQIVGSNGYHSVSFSVDGGGTALTTGVQVPIKIPFGGTLKGYTMMCSPSGSITFNFFRAANTAGLPTASIVNNAGGGGGTGTLPAISSGVEGSSTSFTNWGSTTLTALDNLALNLTTVDGVVTKCTVVLYYQ
jgi:hypothetical protein